jgi:outer membrane lipoprotein-sorting protein
MILTEIEDRTTNGRMDIRVLLSIWRLLTIICLVFGLVSEARAVKHKIPLPPYRPAELGPSAIKPEPETIPLQPAPPVVASQPQAKAAPNKPATTDLSPAELLTAVNEQLTALKQFSAKFSQISGNGQQVSGRLTVLRPGRLRFDYNAPSAITIIADGNAVAVIDSHLGTQDVYAIGLTPLKFLLGNSINLARDFKIIDVSQEGDKVVVYGEDASTFGGTSRIALGFDSKTLLLKQWNVTDPQGYEVQVVLANIDTRHEPDPMLFVIPTHDASRNKN